MGPAQVYVLAYEVKGVGKTVTDKNCPDLSQYLVVDPIFSAKCFPDNYYS